MKTKLLLSFSLLFLLLLSAEAQLVPQGFNYQAIARDAGNAVMTNKALTVRITIQNSLTTGLTRWQETHSVTTDNFGVFTLVIGTGTRVTGTATLFSDVNWSAEALFIKTEVNPGTGYVVMGTTKLNSVPYAMVAEEAIGVTPGTKLSVVSDNDLAPEALFEVKRADGQTVFAVYPDAVNIYVPRSGKGSKGGFAIGGFDGTKLAPQDYFRVTPDSVRVYIDPTPALVKGSKGGFAIGGYGVAKGGINSMYFNLTGASAVNTVDESPQILWYPIKKAFLAGSVHIGAVDSVGQNSTSLGFRSIAMGDYSQAFGFKAKAFGNFSTSIGKNSIAGSKVGLKDNAFAFGNASKALGTDSYAFGSGAEALGSRSFAFGSVGIDESSLPTTTPTRASGDYSVAFGMGAQATNFGAMALGNNSTSSGYASTSLGFYSQASNSYAVAIGYYSKAQGYYGHAFGLASEATGQGSLALGMYAKTLGNYAASIGYFSEAKNPYSVAIGYYAKAQADYSAAFGRGAIANGNSSVAIGYGATTALTGTDAGSFGKNAAASGASSIAVGNGALTGAAATDATSLGKLANATGISSMAIGVSAKSPGNTSTAIGYNADASGDYSFAIGTYGLNVDGSVNALRPTKTTLSYSMAIGMGAQSAKKGDMALGVNSTASGEYSTAMGYGPTSSGQYSTAIGYSPTSGGQYSTAFGYMASSAGLGSMALGYGTSSGGSYSASIGFGSTSTGQYATGIGFYSRANGNKSLAIGAQYNYTYYRYVFNKLTGTYTLMPYTVNKYNTADGDFSVAIGNGNQSTDGGITLGSNNTAIGSGAVAIGHTNTANSLNSFVGGSTSQANGYNAIAMGENINAISANSFVIGSYNVTTGFDLNTSTTWIETDPLFQIGNGESGSPHDAIKVNKNGGTYINAENAYAGLWVTNTNTSANPNSSYGIGLMSGIQRNKAGLTYYSGYFYSMGGSLGTYLGEFADTRSGGAIDVAEYIYDTHANTEAADVVVADESAKESIVKSTKPYQTGVVGIISTKPHMTMGMELVIDEKTGELLKDAKPSARLALTGRVPVKVSGENGAIVPGDYLTSSSTPGFAMKWTLLDVNTAKDFDDLKRILSENERRRGAIIGKALENFSGSGNGKIVVLVSLQ
jgi:hypothetical protein